ncbi:uncharacterized protein LOC103714574 isoform X1 [Phoenix dactylifera]|uniref:Uncharacterized protein LOC103714574 isoform X1 n=1 Tax=Phoenix dactylifera TaxID=42345 RepID=A0A8B7CIR6_PHODC|nr:uncharacterized protein LOC103714574 isoform X1 [Phoenix dactylifera]
MPALPLMVEVLARVQQMPPLSRQGLDFVARKRSPFLASYGKIGFLFIFFEASSTGERCKNDGKLLLDLLFPLFLFFCFVFILDLVYGSCELFHNSEIGSGSTLIKSFSFSFHGFFPFFERSKTPEQRSLIGVTSCRSKLPMNDSWINILALSHWKQWQPVIACNSRGPVETIKHGVTEFSAIPPGILAGYVQACHCS